MPEQHPNPGAEAHDVASVSPSPLPLKPSRPAEAPAQSAGATRTGYAPQLDGLRAVAILMVFCHHAFGIPLLWAGVDLFFILSGYLITNILVRDSDRMRFPQLLRHFYLRRAQRILPAYALCLALIALFSTVDWHRLWPFYAFFLQNVPYAFGWTGFSPLIPLWSLAVEQHFYLFWPFLVFFLPRRWLVPGMLGLLFGVPVLREFCTHLFAASEPIYVLTPFRIDTMAAGALAALVLPTCRPKPVRLWAAAAVLLGLAAYAVLGWHHPWFRRDANTVAFNTLAYSLNILVLGGVFVLVLLASPSGWLYRVLSTRPLRYLGRVSYSFYLLHLLVLLRCSAVLSARTMPFVAFALTLALAALSWHLLEKPVLALGGRHRGAAMSPQRTPS